MYIYIYMCVYIYIYIYIYKTVSKILFKAVNLITSGAGQVEVVVLACCVRIFGLHKMQERF